MSIFEKNCWYWKYVNSKIKEQLTTIPENRKMMIKLENIAEDIPVLFRFLNADPVAVKPQELNTSNEWESYYISKGQKEFLKWGEWDNEQIAVFNNWCGEEMDLWYPGWKNK